MERVKTKISWLERHVSLKSRDSFGEEIANSITHGLGAALSVAGLVLLVVKAALSGDVWGVVGFSLFGASAVNLYLASTLYHGFQGQQVKRLFRILDHTSIYLLIAGTYTAILLTVLRGPLGWTLFGIVWGVAVLGILFEIFLMGKFKKLSVLLYIAMGWIIIIVWGPMKRTVPEGFISWLLYGGAAYTGGVIFYAWKKIPFNHAVWHLCVIGGTFCHFWGMFKYLTCI